MGEHKLKKENPTVRRGQHGGKYYCRNGCGRVIHYLGRGEIFIERAGVPHYGWCTQCIASAQQPATQPQEAT